MTAIAARRTSTPLPGFACTKGQILTAKADQGIVRCEGVVLAQRPGMLFGYELAGPVARFEDSTTGMLKARDVTYAVGHLLADCDQPQILRELYLQLLSGSLVAIENPKITVHDLSPAIRRMHDAAAAEAVAELRIDTKTLLYCKAGELRDTPKGWTRLIVQDTSSTAMLMIAGIEALHVVCSRIKRAKKEEKPKKIKTPTNLRSVKRADLRVGERVALEEAESIVIQIFGPAALPADGVQVMEGNPPQYNAENVSHAEYGGRSGWMMLPKRSAHISRSVLDNPEKTQAIVFSLSARFMCNDAQSIKNFHERELAGMMARMAIMMRDDGMLPRLAKQRKQQDMLHTRMMKESGRARMHAALSAYLKANKLSVGKAAKQWGITQGRLAGIASPPKGGRFRSSIVAYSPALVEIGAQTGIDPSLLQLASFAHDHGFEANRNRKGISSYRGGKNIAEMIERLRSGDHGIDNDATLMQILSQLEAHIQGRSCLETRERAVERRQLCIMIGDLLQANLPARLR